MTNSHITQQKLINSLSSLENPSLTIFSEFKINIIKAIKSKNDDIIKDSIDTLFYQLFDINQREMNQLLKEYYYP